MKITCLLIILTLFSSFLFAQEKVDIQIMQKIKEEEAQHSQIPVLAHYLTDVCGPRLTNSPGYKKAVLWTVQTLKQWGLQNAAPEPWGEYGKGWSNEECYIAMKQPYYHPLIASPAAWINSTPGRVTAKVLLMDKLDSSTIDKFGTEIKGKIVMVKSPDTTLRNPFIADARRYDDSELNKLPESWILSAKDYSGIVAWRYNLYTNLRYLEKKGAVGLFIHVNGKIGRDGTIFSMGLIAYSKRYEPTIPYTYLSAEDYLRLQRILSSGQEVLMDMNVKNRWFNEDLTGYNVVAEIPGDDLKIKNQVVIMGAHLDSWHTGTGATDNAAGCVVMMEAIRILKVLGIQPKRTIRIALWGAEEQGHLGSFGYVKKHYGNPMDMKHLSEQGDVSAYFNLDMGTGKIRGIYLQNNEKTREIFSEWLQPFKSSGATGITKSNVGGSDHLSFDAVGIPAFQFIQDPLNYESRTHHTNMDVYDNLSIEDLKQAATIVAAFIYNTAMRDDMLPRKPLPMPGLYLLENGFLK